MTAPVLDPAVAAGLDKAHRAHRRAPGDRYTGIVSFVAGLDGMRRLTVPYADGQLTGWLRRPAGRSPAGTVIVWIR